MAKSGTEDVLKKDPAAEKAPDAGAVDSDKAKAMFATHAPSPPAVFWSEQRLQLERGVRVVPHRHSERGARGGGQRDVRAL